MPLVGIDARPMRGQNVFLRILKREQICVPVQSQRLEICNVQHIPFCLEFSLPLGLEIANEAFLFLFNYSSTFSGSTQAVYESCSQPPVVIASQLGDDSLRRVKSASLPSAVTPSWAKGSGPGSLPTTRCSCHRFVWRRSPSIYTCKAGIWHDFCVDYNTNIGWCVLQRCSNHVRTGWWVIGLPDKLSALFQWPPHWAIQCGLLWRGSAITATED